MHGGGGDIHGHGYVEADNRRTRTPTHRRGRVKTQSERRPGRTPSWRRPPTTRKDGGGGNGRETAVYRSPCISDMKRAYASSLVGFCCGCEPLASPEASATAAGEAELTTQVNPGPRQLSGQHGSGTAGPDQLIRRSSSSIHLSSVWFEIVTPGGGGGGSKESYMAARA